MEKINEKEMFSLIAKNFANENTCCWFIGQGMTKDSISKNMDLGIYKYYKRILKTIELEKMNSEDYAKKVESIIAARSSIISPGRGHIYLKRMDKTSALLGENVDIMVLKDNPTEEIFDKYLIHRIQPFFRSLNNRYTKVFPKLFFYNVPVWFKERKIEGIPVFWCIEHGKN